LTVGHESLKLGYSVTLDQRGQAPETDCLFQVYIVPYLVAFISLENILIVTQSVMTTPSHLDSKIRVAQGLSLEGWNITKNLFAEITVLTVGFFLGILDHSIQVRVRS
jgi:hypothetical protein